MKTCKKILAAFICLILTSLVSAADQTIMGSPVIGSPIQRPHTKSCSVTVVQDFPFDAFGKVSEVAYAAPKDCPGPWSKVVLEMDGKVDGAQYDRYGFIHLGQIELLRFTTPEPPHHAIYWQVEKDVTQYSSIFAESKNPQTFITQLDSATTEKLNGVYRISAKLIFYVADSKFHAKPQPDTIMAIASDTKNQPYFTLDSTSKPALLQAQGFLSLPTNIIHAYLEVFATPHGNEEFWYLPGGNVAPYREIQIYIDGKLAGIAWPFPYIYTGGFNPHFWTPITAIDALNIPPYKIDLTPFAALLNKPLNAQNTNVHSISIKLNAPVSYWIVDANLLLDTSPSSKSIDGKLTQYKITPLPTLSDIKNQGKQIIRSLSVAGLLHTPIGVITTSIEQKFSLKNEFPAHTYPGNPAKKIKPVISLDQLMTQQVDTKITTNYSHNDRVVVAKNNYSFLISPSIDNMNSDIPKPFIMNQSMGTTVAERLNDVLDTAHAFFEEVKSANDSQLVNNEPQNNYKGSATIYYQDLSGECFYKHLESAQNQLTSQISHDNSNKKLNLNIDIKKSLKATCQ
jgi:hypothetical protein